MLLTALLFSLFIMVSIFLLRLRSSLRPPPPVSRAAGSPTRLLVVLGSGGHTAELLSSLQSLPTSRYTHRTYIVSSGDSFSAEKARAFENTLTGLADLRRKSPGHFDIVTVPRARRVHQSLLTTPLTCVQCFLACVRVLSTAPTEYQEQWQNYASQRSNLGSVAGQLAAKREVIRLGVTPFPDLIVTNGPATGLIVVSAAVFLRFIGIGKERQSDGGGGMRSLFIESWARVRRLSLTGRILVATGACQRVLVQWRSLQEQIGQKVEFVGPVVR